MDTMSLRGSMGQRRILVKVVRWLGLYGGAATFVSKNFSRTRSISWGHRWVYAFSGSIFKCSDWKANKQMKWPDAFGIRMVEVCFKPFVVQSQIIIWLWCHLKFLYLNNTNNNSNTNSKMDKYYSIFGQMLFNIRFNIRFEVEYFNFEPTIICLAYYFT